MTTSPGTGGGLIAVTGVTGALGGRVARRLAASGVGQRLLVRDVQRAPDLAGADVIGIGDGYTDADAMSAALAGVHTLLLVSASESKDRRDVHAAAVDAAVDAGVAHIVYVSFVGAGPYATFTLARDHGHTEEHIRSRGVAFTILRDNMYLDFVPNMVGADGVLRGPAGDGRFGGVTRDDVADVAAAVLTSVAAGEDTHTGRVYDVTGREAISMAEIAAHLTRASGRLITYDAETLDQAYASRSVYGAPDWEVAGWVTSYSAIAAGELEVVTSTVADLAGHEPMTFAEYLAAHPSDVDRLRTA
jgi:NAD(P)H dehydrogenase (quinone)